MTVKLHPIHDCMHRNDQSWLWPQFNKRVDSGGASVVNGLWRPALIYTAVAL